MKQIRVLIFIIAAIPTSLLYAQPIANTKLDTKLPLLNGKAYLNFPTGTVNVQRPVDIMSAGPNPNEETRIIYELGKAHLVFFAQELYLLSDRNLLAEVCNDSAYKGNFTTKVFSSQDSISTILSTPLHYDSSQAAIMIKSLLVQTPDSELFRIDVYIDGAAFANRADFQALTENVFRTLAKGTQSVKRNERSEKYFLLDSTQAFTFHLPVNYCTTVDQQYDFKVFKFHKFRRFTDDSWGDMLIYVGDHPSYVYMDYGLDESDAKKDSSFFLGKPMQWMLFTDNIQSIQIKELVISKDDIGIGTKIHVAMVTNEPPTMPELVKIAEGVEINRK